MKRSVFLMMAILTMMQGNSQGPPRLFTAEELQADHNILVAALREAHPGLYRYQSKDAFDKQEQQIKSSIVTPMTEEQYYKLEMPLLTAIRCGHTKWHRQGRPDDRFAFRQDNIFPLQVYFEKHRATVTGSYGKEVVPKGAEIVAINGKSVESIIGALRQYVTSDGYVESAFYEELNHFFNGYYATFVDTSAVYSIRYKFKGNMRTAALQGVPADTIRSRQTAKTKHQQTLRFAYTDHNAAVLHIDGFYVEKGQQDFYAFMDSVFLVLKDKATTDLIIDLRNNEGGVEEYGGYLFSYLADSAFTYYRKITVASNKMLSVKQHASLFPGYEQAIQLVQEKDGGFIWPRQEYLAEHQPKPNAFRGRVYLLTNGFSFSVTAEFAAAMRAAGRATFIGQETGGVYEGNNSGVFISVTLPNTKLTVGIPLLGFYMNVPELATKGRGIKPDISVTPAAEDILSGKDPVMKKAIELIRQKQVD